MATSYRGLILAGRYRLEERLHTNPDGEVWRSLDSTLDRKVSVRLMRPGHPFAADVADAARRAALIDDPRLVRVLDVGSDGDAGFVVSEYLDGDSLATLVERSPLSAPAVRRIIGEVAQGLDVAAARGLHHLRLTPRSVMVCRDNTVKISGTAVEAAAAGLEPGHAATANRVDAVALVALLYSGLTGRWPLGDAGFPPAPRGEGGSPVPPADLVPGVPNDLDTLCVVTLGSQDDGPRSPAELVAELSPWLPPEEAPLRAAPRRIPREGAAAAPNPALTMRSRMSSTKRSAANQAGAAAKKASAAAKKTAPAADQIAAEASPGAPSAASAATAGSPAASAPTPAPPPSPNPPRRSATLFPTPSVAATGSLPIPIEPVMDRPRRMDSLFTQSTVYPARPGSPATDPATPSPGSSPATPASGRPAQAPGGTPNRGLPRPGSNGAGRGAPPASPAEPLVPWGAGWNEISGAPSRLESTGPFPILIPAEAPPRAQSRLVIFSVTTVLVLVLVVAAFSLRNFGRSGGSRSTGQSTPLPSASAAPQTPVASTAAAPSSTPSITPSATPSATPPSVPVQIAAIRAIDPEGDGDEDTASSPLAVDGDPSTFWKSDTYHSAEFGGLKTGVGLALRLKKTATLHSVTIDVNGFGGSVEVRTADGPDEPSSTVVGKGSFNNGKLTVRTSSAKPAKYVILWFTKLPSVAGQYKVEVSEVRLK